MGQNEEEESNIFLYICININSDYIYVPNFSIPRSHLRPVSLLAAVPLGARGASLQTEGFPLGDVSGWVAESLVVAAVASVVEVARQE